MDAEVDAEAEEAERLLESTVEAAASPFPPGGPRRVWRAPGGTVAWAYRAPRVEAERAGIARMAGSSLRPPLRRATARMLAFEALGLPVDPLVVARARAAEAGAPRRRQGTREALLSMLAEGSSPRRALRRAGVPRRRVDRYLSAPVGIASPEGPILGGLAPGWYRGVDGRIVAFRADRVRTGLLAVDLAGLLLGRPELRGAIAALHRAAVDAPGPAADEALALARVALACREQAHRAEPVAGLGGLVEGALEAAPPVARVWIEGPAFVDVTRWASPGEEVPAHRARWLLRNVDGLAVGGSRLSVRTDPPLRPGRGASRRGERSERRRALFSRWDEGVQVDDEGLLSLTPEALALEIARGARGVVIDGTAGVGGLTIAFARQPEVHRVVAVDRDRARLARAMHNARIYGVHAKVTAVPGDLLAHLGALRGDLLVVDPPWGGRGYDREHVGVEDLGLDLRSVLARWSGPMVLKLPRSFDVGQLEGFRVSAAIDARGILKFLIARRP